MLISIFYKKFVGLKDIFLQCTNNFLALNFQEKQVLFRNLINFKNIFNLIFQGKEGGLSSDRNLDVGDKVCLKLCENYFNTQFFRNDNLIISESLIKEKFKNEIRKEIHYDWNLLILVN